MQKISEPFRVGTSVKSVSDLQRWRRIGLKPLSELLKVRHPLLYPNCAKNEWKLYFILENASSMCKSLGKRASPMRAKLPSSD